MRIESGDATRTVSFVAVDATDLKTFETGLATWTVYRSRNGAAEVAYTTPTITEIDLTNTPGLYAILIDEDTTITSGVAEEEVVLRITHAGMAPVTISYTLFQNFGVSIYRTAQAGAASTITLAAAETSTDDAVNGDFVLLVAGTGSGQQRQITDYVGSTRVATVDRAWVTTPDNTTVYRRIYGSLGSTVTEIQSGLATVEGVFQRAFEATKMGGLDFEEIIGLMASVLLGKSTGVAAGSPVYRNPGDSANAVSATASSGDRSAVTLTAASVR